MFLVSLLISLLISLYSSKGSTEKQGGQKLKLENKNRLINKYSFLHQLYQLLGRAQEWKPSS